ncbi:MAG: hypothetical protein WBE76_23955 [Terracidiphilus sp.]
MIEATPFAKIMRESIHNQQLSGECQMPKTKYENQTITNQILQVEDCWFVNCTLKQCVLYYSGGTPEFENARFENCQWKFQGAAQQTIALLSLIGLLPIQPTHLQPRPQPTGPLN